MNYIRFNEYDYQEHPNESTIWFGTSETSVFIHQLIEDTEMRAELLEAVNKTNEISSAYAADEGFDITFTLPERIMVDGNDYIICQQSMMLSNGYQAVQQNLYFYDPAGGIFRIVQFGTAPLSPDVWEIQGEAVEKYSAKLIRQMLANMALPDGVFRPEIKRFVPVLQ